MDRQQEHHHAAWFTRHHTWTLVDTSVLVRTGVFGQVVDIDTRFAWINSSSLTFNTIREASTD